MTRLSLRAALAALLFAAATHAHFPFVVPDESGAAASLYLSELLEPDPEVKVELLAGTELKLRDATGKDAPLKLTKDRHRYTTTLVGDGTRVIHGVSDLGVMQRGDKPAHWLVYYPKTIVGDAFDPASVLGNAVPVELIPVRDGQGVKLKLVIDGKPAPKAEIRIITPDGAQDDYATDDAGLTERFNHPGRYGAWARSWVDEQGEAGGKAYTQRRNYATIVFDFGQTTQAAPATQPASAIPPLPQAVASFGAVVCDGHLYVYGGHTAERHNYSTASVSGRFHRIALHEPRAWEALPAGVAVQGMNLATHAGRVYRVGGMEPRNRPGEDEDNHSIATAQAFDPAAGAWRDLPPLPTPRSSHDLVVVGTKLHVVGGWHMKGTDGNDWLATTDVIDLSATEPRWQSIEQPWQRRALIAVALDDKLLVMGGMDEDDKISLEVDILDTTTNTWSKGPAIPGKGIDGFSPAACVVEGRVYLSVGSGKLLRLDKDLAAWTEIAHTTPRVVHRMVATDNGLLLIGGAAKSKMLDLIEFVPLDEK